MMARVLQPPVPEPLPFVEVLLAGDVQFGVCLLALMILSRKSRVGQTARGS
jgi:hypothetical protein